MQQLIRRGQLVGPSTERLTEQLMALKAHSNAYSALGENVTNALKEIPVRTADGFLTILDTIGVTELVKALNKLFGVDSKKEKEGQSNELLRRLDKISRGTMIGGGALNRRPNERPGGRF